MSIVVSESIEMYLVTTALLSTDGQPVPLSMLAHHLSISPVSANEMCRKLVERGLIDYQPYKGVTLTNAGETLAQRVLMRRRLWETFLVEKLGIDEGLSEDIACRLEHITSDQLMEHLSQFLAHCEHTCDYAVSLSRGQRYTSPAPTLTTLTAGERAQVLNIVADDVIRDFLHRQGVVEGVMLQVLAVGADGAQLIALEREPPEPHPHLALSAPITAHIHIRTVNAQIVHESTTTS